MVRMYGYKATMLSSMSSSTSRLLLPTSPESAVRQLDSSNLTRPGSNLPRLLDSAFKQRQHFSPGQINSAGNGF